MLPSLRSAAQKGWGSHALPHSPPRSGAWSQGWARGPRPCLCPELPSTPAAL